MKKIIQYFAVTAGVAICAVVCYSKGLLGLRPNDPDIIKAGSSIIIAVVLAAVFIWQTVQLMTSSQKRVSMKDGLGAEELIALLQTYTHKPYVGEYASSTISQLESLSRKVDNINVLVGHKFQKGSISWSKFKGVLDAAQSSVHRNGQLLVAKIQGFDIQECKRIFTLIESEKYKDDQIDDNLQLEKYALYKQHLLEMNDIVDTDEKLLLRLDQFAGELSRLETNKVNKNNNEMLEEIDVLIRQTGFYQ